MALLVACASGGGKRAATVTSTSTPASTSSSSTTSSTSTSVAPSATTRAPTTAGGAGPTTPATAAEVTIRGVVASAFASARVVSLVAAVQGFTDIAVTTDTDIRRADGRAASLADVGSGATVEATGRPGTATSLVARRLVIVS